MFDRDKVEAKARREALRLLNTERGWTEKHPLLAAGLLLVAMAMIGFIASHLL